MANAECDDGDATNGVESCVAATCRPGKAPPRVVSITPADGAEDAEPDGVVRLTFSEPLDPASAAAGALRLLNGDTEVSGKLELSAEHDALTFTPKEALSLWTKYRVEVASSLRASNLLAPLAPFSASFQVRDGAWHVEELALGASLKLPRSLPVSRDGSLLVSWLTEESGFCAAAGGWVRGGQSDSSRLFKAAAREGACKDLSASVAADGSAAVTWVAGVQDYSQTFVNGAWDPSERMNRERIGESAEASTVFAHLGKTMTTFTRVVTETTSPSFMPDVWLMRGKRLPGTTGVATSTTSPVQGAFDENGSGFAAWSELLDGARISVLRYQAPSAAWDKRAAAIPGSFLTKDSREPHRRSVPGVALTPGGDALVLWLEELGTKRWLKSSRYVVSVGWQPEPVTLSTDPSMDPLTDAPALVFDGQGFVAAWTGQTAGSYAAYTARYDLQSDSWAVEEPHVSGLGPSALSMPRLAADAHGNLLLVWAIAGSPTLLSYQRYHAGSGAWGEIQRIPDVEIDGVALDGPSAVPLSLGANGAGGLLFKTRGNGSESLSVAEFF